MTTLSLTLSAVLFLLAGTATDVSIVQRFLPSDAHVCSLRTADVRSGRVTERRPAVLRGSLIPLDSSNIVAAYSTESGEGCRSVSVLVLGRQDNDWKKIASLSFPEEFLWMEQGKTNGLQIRKFAGSPRESLVIITSKGAALGARIQILQWDEPSQKFVNLAPSDAGGTSFEIPTDSSLVVHSKNKSFKYEFNGKRFVRSAR